MGLVNATGGDAAASCAINIGAGKAALAVPLFNAHFEGKKFKNPYNSSNPATKDCAVTIEGCTLIEVSGTDSVKISSCYEDPCTLAGDTSLVDTISLK